MNESVNIKMLIKTLKFTDKCPIPLKAKGSQALRNRSSPISVTNYIIVVSFASIARSRRIKLFVKKKKRKRSKKKRAEDNSALSFEAKDFYFYRVTRIPSAGKKIEEGNKVHYPSNGIYLKEWSRRMPMIVCSLLKKCAHLRKHYYALKPVPEQRNSVRWSANLLNQSRWRVDRAVNASWGCSMAHAASEYKFNGSGLWVGETIVSFIRTNFSAEIIKSVKTRPISGFHIDNY